MSYDLSYCCISSMQHIEYGAPFHGHDPDCPHHPSVDYSRENEDIANRLEALKREARERG